MIDLEGALAAMRDLMLTISELDSVGIGAPESQLAQSFGWVTLGDPDVEPGQINSVVRSTAGGPYELTLNLIAWFGANVEGQEEAAERRLARYVADFVYAVINNRTGDVGTVALNLNGTVHRMGLPQAATGASDYARFAMSDTRIYPLGVRVTLR